MKKRNKQFNPRKKLFRVAPEIPTNPEVTIKIFLKDDSYFNRIVYPLVFKLGHPNGETMLISKPPISEYDGLFGWRNQEEKIFALFVFYVNEKKEYNKEDLKKFLPSSVILGIGFVLNNEIDMDGIQKINKIDFDIDGENYTVYPYTDLVNGTGEEVKED